MSVKMQRRRRGDANRILIVDDEADIRELLDLTLRASGQRHHAGLGRRIVSLSFLGAPANHGGSVDDHASLALLDHLVAGIADAPEGAGQGDVDDSRPLLICHFKHGVGATEPRIVDHDVDATELVCRVYECLDLLLDGHIADQ